MIQYNINIEHVCLQNNPRYNGNFFVYLNTIYSVLMNILRRFLVIFYFQKKPIYFDIFIDINLCFI